MNPLISVVVPVYNSEAYLDECILSILNQSHENLELILVDDGSTDSSVEICQQYATFDKRVKVVCQQNQGAAAARNTGILQCQGIYIGFVDSDDYIDRDMYEVLLKKSMDFDADVAQILSRRVDDAHHILNEKLIRKTEGVADICSNRTEAIEHYMRGNHSLCSHLYKADLFSTVKIPEGMIGEDIAVIIPLYSQIKRLVKINQYKYNYRYNQNSVTNTPLNQRKLNLLDEFERQAELYKNNTLYRDLTIQYIANLLLGFINSILLCKNSQFKSKEKEFKNKMMGFMDEFKRNRYISKKTIWKMTLFLKCRQLYILALRIKRCNYKKPLYGAE